MRSRLLVSSNGIQLFLQQFHFKAQSMIRHQLNIQETLFNIHLHIRKRAEYHIHDRRGQMLGSSKVKVNLIFNADNFTTYRVNTFFLPATVNNKDYEKSLSNLSICSSIEVRGKRISNTLFDLSAIFMFTSAYFFIIMRLYQK